MQIFVRFFVVLLALANNQCRGKGTKPFFLHKPTSSTTPPPSPPVTHHLTTHATPPSTSPGTTPPPPDTVPPTNPPDDAPPTDEEILQSFNDFKTNFNKTYSSPEEEQKRIEIYSDNFKKIFELGKIDNLPYQLKINEFGDLTTDEFNEQLNALVFPDEKANASTVRRSYAKAFDIRKNVDWRDQGAVLPARNQGECGSCYAFAAAAALEAYFFKQTKKLQYLSTQQIIDCAKGYGGANNGCKGGTPGGVFQYVEKFGIDPEDVYTYEEKDDKSCRIKKDKIVGKIRGYRDVPRYIPDGLEKAVSTEGPITVGIDARADSFHFYSGGIYYEPTCDPNEITHAVLLIGYGTETNGEKYWLIKNSYGTSWGDDGFGKIARNVSNHCGIRNYAVYPL